MVRLPSACRLALAALALALAGAPAAAALDLAAYRVVLQRGLDLDEASGIAYNWDKNVLFVVDDAGTAVAEYSLAGVRLSADRLSGYRDVEGVSYIGDGQYVLAEERTEEIVRIGAVSTDRSGPIPRTVYTAKRDAPKYAIHGGTNIGNNGLEGIAFDPISGGFFGVRQGGTAAVTEAVYLSQVRFDPQASEPTTQPFNPAPLGLGGLSDIAVLAANPNFAGTDYFGNLLILSADARRLIEVSRTGTLLSSFDLAGLMIQKIEGVTIDFAGNIYLVGETGGISPSFDHPGRISTSGLVVLSRAREVKDRLAGR